MADEITLYMVENWSVATIKAAMDKVFAAHVSAVSEPTSITGVSNDGSSMSMTVSANAADRLRFLTQCRTAIAELNGTANPGGPGIKLDFSTRCAST